ncbi:MAG: aldehyde ferredoxin oxidoreductase family protein [Chloroflexi bacterium]|nr:aldehyde ferredoxin oxidoreductase family protein [Chloroflexota bacterium]MDA8187975.1 aldehyde ferredoxin oxidoreductase family protein [Dehalococcoidales bacterium]
MYGWAGKMLRVDLTRGTIEQLPLDPKFARQFLGGRGFNSRILYDEVDPRVADPYDPRNVICISAGALSGTLAPSSGRVTISVGRSPVTGVFGDGNAGGHLSPELKYAGFDSLVIKGRSEKPVYLAIHDDRVELRDASHIWGKDVWEADQIIREEMGDPQAQVFAIGPAGENRAAIAVTICNLTRGPGGGGNGAVMGSKNLKAVAVRGTRGVKIADPDAFMAACQEAHGQIRNHPIFESYSRYGTPVLLGVYNAGKALPVRNWQDNTYANAEELDGPTFVKKHSKKSKACFGCPMHCSHYYVVEDGPYAGTAAEGVEYEATDGFGARSGNDDLGLVLYMNKLCNLLGLCVVQTSNVICTAMHLWQDGIIDADDTGGLALEWGSAEAMIELAHQVAYRRGFGALFADGFMSMARQIAEKKGLPVEQVERYIIQNKGMTLSSYDARPYKGGALEVGTSTRGADHLRGLPTLEVFAHWYRGKREEIIADLDIPPSIVDQWMELDLLDRHKYAGKAHMVQFYQDQCAAADALEICKFITSWRFGIGPNRMARLLSAATGVPYTWEDILRCGERIYAVEYAIQRRFGLRRKDDYPPVRFMEEPLPTGDVVERDGYEQMLDEYYAVRGYDAEGRPTRARLEALDMANIADDLANYDALGE